MNQTLPDHRNSPSGSQECFNHHPPNSLLSLPPLTHALSSPKTYTFFQNSDLFRNPSCPVLHALRKAAGFPTAADPDPESEATQCSFLGPPPEVCDIDEEEYRNAARPNVVAGGAVYGAESRLDRPSFLLVLLGGRFESASSLPFRF